MKRTVVIDEPYWSAWKEFGWLKGTWGIGLNERILFHTEGSFLRIYSKYHKCSYLVNLAEAVKVAKIGKNKPRGTKLWVIPMDILKPDEVIDGGKVAGKGQEAQEVQKTGEKVSSESQQDMFGGKIKYGKSSGRVR